MIGNFFESNRFKKLLAEYDKAKIEGTSLYLDSDEFIYLSDYFVENGYIEEAEISLRKGMDLHPDSKDLKVAYAGVLVCNHKFDEVVKTIENITLEDNYDVLYIQAQLKCAQERNCEEGNKLFHKWLEYIDQDYYETKGQNDEEDLDSEDDDEDEVFYEDHEYNPDNDEEEERFDYNSKKRDARYRIVMSFIEFAGSKDEQDKYVGYWCENYLSTFDYIGRYVEDYSMAEVCRELGLLDLLERFLIRILDVNPYKENGWTNLGIAQNLNNKQQDALNSLEFALAINPDDGMALATYSQCMYERGNYQKSLEALLKLQELKPEITQEVLIAKCYDMIGDKDEAFKRYKQIFDKVMDVNINSDNAALAYDLAETMFNFKDYIKSMELLNHILKFYPANYKSTMLRGVLLLATDQVREATEIFTTLLQKYDNDSEVILDVASRYIAFNYDEAGVSLLKIIPVSQYDYQNYRACALLAIAYFKLMNNKECRHYLKILCENAPETAMIYFDDIIPDTLQKEDYFDWLSKKLNIMMNNK